MVGGISGSTLSRINTLLKEVGKAVDEKSHAGVTVSVGEAEKIKAKFGELTPTEQAVVGKAFVAYLQADIFKVSDKARDVFATMLGKTAAELTPRDTAGLVGASQKRTVLDATFKMMTGAAKIDASSYKKVLEALKDAPKALQQFVTAAITDAEAKGEIKLEPEARKAHVGRSAKLDDDGGVSAHREAMREKPTERTAETAEANGPQAAPTTEKEDPNWKASFLDGLRKRLGNMAATYLNPPTFEGIVAAFLNISVKDANDQTMKMMADMEVRQRDDQKHGEAKQAKRDAAVKQLLGNGGANGAGGETPAAEPGKPDAIPSSSKVARQLEGLIQSIDAHKRDDGIIDAREAQQIVGRLEKFPKEMKGVLAESLGAALQHSGILDTSSNKAGLEPLKAWVLDQFPDMKKAGKLDFPLPTPIKPGENPIDALRKSDSLGHRLAVYVVDMYLGSNDPAVKEKLQQIQPLMGEMLTKVSPEEAAKRSADVTKRDFAKAMFGSFSETAKLIAQNPAKKDAVIASLNKALTDSPDMKKLPPAAQQALTDAVNKGLAQITDKSSPADVQKMFDGNVGRAMKTAFAAAVDSLPPKTKQEMTEAQGAVIGDALDQVRTQVHDKISDGNDRNQKLSPEDKMKAMQEAIARQQAALKKEFPGPLGDELAAKVAEGAGPLVAELKAKGDVEPAAPPGANKDSFDPAATDATRSRQLMFERLKFVMNMASEMMQAMSNILNTLHQNAENTIRAIR